MLLKGLVFVLGALYLVNVTGLASLAQTENSDLTTVEQSTNNQQPLPDPVTADLVIQGNVSAERVRFDRVPDSGIRFFGTANRRTGWQTERQNIPKDPKRGVTYRNVNVNFKILSVFEDPAAISQPSAVTVPQTLDVAPSP